MPKKKVVKKSNEKKEAVKKKKFKKVEEEELILDDEPTDEEESLLGEESNKQKKGEVKPGKWFFTSKEGREERKKEETQIQLRQSRNIWRYRLDMDEEALVIFIDTPTFYIYENFNIKIGGKFGNYITCMKEYGSCPICNSGEYSSLIAYGTVIDYRKYTRKDGTVSEWRKNLFPIKGDNLSRFEDILAEHKDLAGKAFKVKRFGKKDYTVGSQFVYKGKVDIASKFGKEAAEPLDYKKVLAPLSNKELEGLGFSDGTFIYGSTEDIGGDNKMKDLDDLNLDDLKDQL